MPTIQGVSGEPRAFPAFSARIESLPDDGDAGTTARIALWLLQGLDELSRPVTSERRAAIGAELHTLDELLRRIEPTYEVRMLLEVSRMALAPPVGRPMVVLPAILAWAQFLDENRMLLHEAEEVLSVAIEYAVNGDEPQLEVQARTHFARVCRRLSRYDDAVASYLQAEALARRAADGPAERLARIGRAIVMLYRGDVSTSEALLRATIPEAKAAEDPMSESRACQNLAVTYLWSGRPREAVPYAFRAAECTPERIARTDGFINLGTALKQLGYFSTAVVAFQLALRAAILPEREVNALAELLECAGRMGDQLGMERWERRLRERPDRLAPALAANLAVRRGFGLAAMGEPAKAIREFRDAVALAEVHGLEAHRIEALEALARLERNPGGAGDDAPAPSPEPDAEISALHEALYARLDSAA